MRLLFAVLLAGGLAAVTVATQDRPATPVPAHGQDHFLVCAKACDDCARSCDYCAAHCAGLVAAGNKHHDATLKTCLDCAAVCRAAASITAKSGPFADLICAACADACKRCGDECARHGQGDATMTACADECRRCEKACRDMLTHVGRPGEKK